MECRRPIVTLWGRTMLFNVSGGGLSVRLLLCFFLLAGGALFGAVHKLSLQQALTIAARQNPDIALARLDAERAKHDIQIAGDMFSAKVTLRGDAVYTDGYPNAIGPDAHSPSILHQETDMALYNRPQRYQVAAAKQDAFAAQLGPKAKADDVARQVASLYLDVEESWEETKALQSEVDADRRIAASTSSKVSGGYVLPVELLRSKVETAQTLQRLHGIEDDRNYSESLIATALGFNGDDLVEPTETEENFTIPPMKSQDQAVNVALLNNKELQRLESGLLARRLERKSYGAFRLPQLDLVEQYSLFAQRTYQDYFPVSKFQRNNAELGASFTLPILIGLEPGARLQQAYVDEEKLQVQISDLIHRIRADLERGFQELTKAQDTLQVARQQLDLAHDENTVAQAQYEEGRSLLSDVEQTMSAERERQLSVYRDEAEVQRAKLNLLRQLGNLMPTLTGNRP